jgi:hypothetical protein
MSGIAPLFATAALIAAALASISIWSPRRLPVKLGSLMLAAAFMPMGYAALADLLSKPKPVGYEWWLGNADHATVLASTIQEGEGIYLWLQLDNVAEPRAYVLPWDRKLAEQLQKAMQTAEEEQGGVGMRLPFEPSLDDREPKFYALPQPAPPPKDTDRPPAQVYRHPGMNV